MSERVSFWRRQWFLLALVSCVLLGLVDGARWEPLAEQAWLRFSIVVSVMFLMALPLDAQTMLRTLRRPAPAFLAVLLTYGLMPLLAWPLLAVFSPETGRGIVVAAVTPCTLASAAVWTRRAGGNDASAILVTLLTNGSCFVVAPCWLWLILGSRVDSLDWWQLVTRLALLVLVPIGVAQVLRRGDWIADWSQRKKPQLSLLAQVGILAMVFLGAVKLGPHVREQQGLRWLETLGMAGAVIGLHVVVLSLGWWSAGKLRLARPERIAVGFAGSQKTLMIGLSLAMDLGVSILPMVTFHVGQLFVDTLIADRWRQHKPEGMAVEGGLKTSES